MNLRRILSLVLLGSFLALGWANRAMASEGASKEETKQGASKEASDENGGASSESGKKGGKKKDEVVTGGRFEGDPVYVHLPQTLVPIIDEDGYQQVLHMLIDVGVKDLNVATKMKGTFPRIQDAILSNLYKGMSDGSLRAGKAVDINKTKQRIVFSLRALFGEDSIKEVLVQGLEQRPF